MRSANQRFSPTVSQKSTQTRPSRSGARIPDRAAADTHNPDHHGATMRVRSALAERLGPHRYHMWFGQADVNVRQSFLRVEAATPFVAQWIDAHFRVVLRDVAKDALGPDAQVTIEVAPGGDHATRAEDGAPDGNHPPPSRALRHERPLRATGPNETSTHCTRSQRLLTMDDFVIGTTNRLAHTAACRLADEDTPRGLSPLFIHGECGVGKTHLLQAICQRVLDRGGRGHRVRYVTGEQFTNEYITALRANAIDEFRQRVRRLDLLAIDDVHFLANKVKTQGEFQCTLDAIDFAGARVAIASDNHPHHIRRFSQSLISRFLSGMVVKIERPDRELRTALVRRLAERRGLRLTEAALAELAAAGGASVRELEGLVTRLAAYHALTQGAAADAEIGLLLVEQVLREDRARPRHVVRIATVIEHVCEQLRISRSDLLGDGRHRRIVIARAMVAYLARELTALSFPEIAKALGRDNHSTVHTADQRLRRQLQANEQLGLDDVTAVATIRELADVLRRAICSGPTTGTA